MCFVAIGLFLIIVFKTLKCMKGIIFKLFSALANSFNYIAQLPGASKSRLREGRRGWNCVQGLTCVGKQRPTKKKKKIKENDLNVTK